MKKTFYLFALLLLCAASGCNKPGIGYLYADKAAYSIDTMRIVRVSNMQNKIADLQEIFQSYPSHITKLMSETDELQKDYDVKEIAEKYIEGEPQVSTMPVMPDATGTMIRGMNAEDTSLHEGIITYSIYKT